MLKARFLVSLLLSAASSLIALPPAQAGVGASFSRSLDDPFIDALDPDMVLREIRQILLEEAALLGASVRGVSYIDESGALRESFLFRSSAHAKRVQIGTYLSEAGRKPNLLLEEISIAESCPFEDAMAHPRVVNVTSSRTAARTAGADIYLDEFEKFLVHSTVNELSGKNWRASHTPVRRPPRSTVYSKYAFGSGEHPSASYEMQWSISLLDKNRVNRSSKKAETPWLVASIGDRLPFDNRAFYHQGMNLSLKMRLKQTLSGEVRKESEFEVALPKLHATYDEGDFQALLQSLLNEKIAQAIWEITMAVKCDPLLFKGEVLYDKTVEARMGYDHGLRVGQWVLGGARSLIGYDWLDESNLDSLAIYEVTEVRDLSSTLKPLTQLARDSQNLRSMLFVRL